MKRAIVFVTLIAAGCSPPSASTDAYKRGWEYSVRFSTAAAMAACGAYYTDAYIRDRRECLRGVAHD